MTENEEWRAAAQAMVTAEHMYFQSPSIINHQRRRVAIERLEQLLIIPPTDGLKILPEPCLEAPDE